jgi:hypothetical protein
MKTTTELLDAAKLAAGCESDYRFATTFGIKPGTVSTWRTGRSTPDDDHAELIAGILHREPGEIMAICAAERAKDANSRTRWLRVAALLAAAVMPPAASGGTGAGSHNNPDFSQSNQDIIGIMSNRLGYLLRRFLFGDWMQLA